MISTATDRNRNHIDPFTSRVFKLWYDVYHACTCRTWMWSCRTYRVIFLCTHKFLQWNLRTNIILLPFEKRGRHIASRSTGNLDLRLVSVVSKPLFLPSFSSSLDVTSAVDSTISVVNSLVTVGLTNEKFDSEVVESSAEDLCLSEDKEEGTGEDWGGWGIDVVHHALVVSGTLVVDGRFISLIGIDFDRPDKFENDFPFLRELIGLVTWFLEEGGGFLRPDGDELCLLAEEGTVDAPGGDGDENDVAVETRCTSLIGAVSGKETRTVADSYCFREDGIVAFPLLGGPFLFFPSVKSGFLLWLSATLTFGFFAVDALFLPLLSVRFPPPPSSIRDFRFFAGTERAWRLQASSLAAPSQDLLDSRVVVTLLISENASTSNVGLVVNPSTTRHWGPGCSLGLHRRLRFFLFFRLRHLNLSLPSFSWSGKVGQMDCCATSPACKRRWPRPWCLWRTLCWAPNIRLCKVSTRSNGAICVNTRA